MSRAFFTLTLLVAGAFFTSPALAQSGETEKSTLLELSKKIDEQNTKIDALSQQILKLEQIIEHEKVAPAPTTVGVATEENVPTASAIPVSGNIHVVSRGETLTSIAKQYKVGIDELQKFNHIEDARKLQPGQKLAIPGTATPSPTP